MGGRAITQLPPVVYQRRESGEVVAVEAAYVIEENGTVGVTLGDYNRAAALVIDPVLSLQVYLAGGGGDAGLAAARDSQGFLYLGGYTYSPDFPLVGDSYQKLLLANASSTPNGACWLMKLNPFATNLNNLIVYSTFFGGTLARR